jgi:signal transduction histidine kinase/ligand-binding sensor domain-containing protein/DNA-binding response OmpR family regulator
MPFKNSILILFLLCGCCLNILAQLRFERIGNQQGLSQSTVLKIFQDKKGFIWFATRDGLNKYDGYNFTVYRHIFNNPNSISSSNITCITEDFSGNLWIGTADGGINKMDKNSGNFIHFNETEDKRDISNLNISSILVTKDNHILATMYKKGILIFDNLQNSVSWENIDTKPANTNYLSQIYQDRQNNVFLGGSNGEIIQVNNKVLINRFKINSNLSPKKEVVTCFFEDSQGNILIGTRGNGLFKLDIISKKISQILYNPSQTDRDNLIMSLAYDQEGTLWVGTDSGVILIKNNDFKSPIHLQANPDSETGLSSHAIQGMLVDRDDNVWIGTWEAGLNVHFKNRNKFMLYRHKTNTEQSLLRDKVTSIACGDDNKVWIGSNTGLTLLDRPTNNYKHFIIDPSTSAIHNNNDINYLHTDKDGDLIILTWGVGMRILKKNSSNFLNYRFNNGIYSPNLTCVQSSKKPNQLWIGTQDYGILTFDKLTGKFTPFTELNQQGALAEFHVNTILEDSHGILWIGSYNRGMYRYDPKSHKIVHFMPSDEVGSIKGNHVFQIFEDSQKRIWIATNGGGLCLYQPKTNIFKNWTTQDGLPNNTIMGILEDKHQNLWLATNDGLSNFIVKSNSFKNYSRADGLQGSEFLINAYAQSKSGEMFFGGTGGMNVFHPDSLTESNKVPPVYITGVKLFNKPVFAGQKDSPLQKDILATDELIFESSQNVFSLEFTALDFESLKNNHYAYILEGFDKDWQSVGTQRIANYTNLNSGEYTFRVKATNNDGVWNPQQAMMKIIVLPPWYKTWWAFWLYGGLIVVSIYAFRKIIQVRERFKLDLKIQEKENTQIQELDRLKTNFFTNISHEFRTPLTLIISPLEKYLSENDNLTTIQRNRAESIYRNAKQLQKLINQLLDLSKLEAGRLFPEITQSDIIEFTEKVTNSFQDLAEQKHILLQFITKEKQLMAYFDSDIVEKILTNLLSNAFKFSKEGGEIIVSIASKPSDNQKVIMKVSDNGIGISAENLSNIFNRFYQVNDFNKPQVVGTGVGLSLCKELAELHRGEILVSSKIGEGTTFSVYLPITKNAFDIQWIRAGERLSENQKHQIEKSIQYVGNQEVKVANKDKPLILIAEDNEDLRLYIKEIFIQNFQIIEAENGKAALKIAQESLPDLIISDWMMPQMTGVELCESVKSDAKTSHIPVIILTSKSSNESKLLGLETGADDYITKPFNASLLEVRVKNILENRKKLRELFSISPKINTREITLNSSDEHFLERIIKIVEDNLSNINLDIAFLEEELKLTNMQMYRKLKSLTNLSGNEFIKNIRLKKAVQLLESENYNVSEIAYKVGFSDPSYFSRTFKKQYGKAPSEYVERGFEV